MSRSIRNLLLIILFGTLLPCIAFAGGVKNVYLSVTPCEDGEEMPQASVLWYKDGKTWYFFLPGGTDWEELRLWTPDYEGKISINGVEIGNGERLIGITGDSQLTLEAGKTSYSVVIMSGSAVGALFFSTESGSMTTVDKSKDNKEGGTAYFLNPDGSTAYDGGLKHIKLRGNTSATMSKKNYGFKLEKGTSLMGMDKAKRWVLLGSARDRSLIRNQIVYNMADYVGLKYTPETAQVDVYFNHEYNGVYLLAEKIEVNDGRVEIDDLEDATQAVNDQPLESYPQIGAKKTATKGKYKAFQIPNDPEDITGGYIIEYENYQPRYKSELCAYTTTRGKVLLCKSPEIASQAQMEYISTFMQGYENAIFAEDGIDPDTGKSYDEFVDFDSLVLKYMLEEVSMNCDGNASSQYYVKPADSQSTVAFAGPAWDYDTTFGDYATAKRKALLDPTAFLHNTVNSSKYWWPQLYAKSEFLEGIKIQWKKAYAPAMAILLGEETDEEGRLLSIQEYADLIADSAAMNFVRWPMTKFGSSSTNIARTGYTIEDNISYLTNFIQQRRDFLETEWGS